MKLNSYELDNKIYSKIVRNPDLWLTLIKTGFDHSSSKWWRNKPFIPLPDEKWINFRLKAAYGDTQESIDASDFITWLRWRKEYFD